MMTLFFQTAMLKFSLIFLLAFDAFALQILAPDEPQKIQPIGKNNDQNFEEKPPTTVRTALEKIARKGDTLAQFSLANMYRLGIDVRTDHKLAFYWYSQAAEAGNAAAQFHLGNYYASGLAVLQNLDEAVAWYQQSATQDFVAAQSRLAEIYQAGALQNPEKSEYWHARAAHLGFAKSQYELGKILSERGENDEAKRWLEAASRQNFESADKALRALRTTIKYPPRSQKTADISASDFAPKNDDQNNHQNDWFGNFPSAKDIRASLEKNQQNVVQPAFSENLDGDKKLFFATQKAAEDGDAKSQNRLAMMYINGTGTAADIQKARYWASLSARSGDREGLEILRFLVNR